MIGVIFATLFQGIFFAIVAMLFVGGLLRKMGIITISSSKTIVTWTVVLMMVYFFIAIGKNVNDYNTDQKAAKVVGTWKAGKHIMAFSEDGEVFDSNKPNGTTRYQISVNEGIIRIYKSQHSSDYDDYEYKLSWGKLKLTDSNGKKTKYKKTSSEYKGEEMCQNPFSEYSTVLSEEDDISGAYVDDKDGVYVLLKADKENNNGFGLSDASEYELYKLDKTLEVENFEEGYLLSLNHYGGEYQEEVINHRAYIAKMITMEVFEQGTAYPYYYGLNADKTKLQIWKPDYTEDEQKPFYLNLTLKEAYNMEELKSEENSILESKSREEISVDSQEYYDSADAQDYLGNAKADEYFEEDFDNEDYVIPDSSSRYLTNEDLENLSLEELKLARNELYAKKGRIFNSAELREYFKNKWWYEPRVEGEVMDAKPQSDYFNEYEIANLLLIKEWEEKRQ